MALQSKLSYAAKRTKLDDSISQKRKYRGSFHESWKKIFEWVENDHEKDYCHCTMCIEAVAKGMHYTASANMPWIWKHSIDANNGFHSWNDAKKAMSAHAERKCTKVLLSSWISWLAKVYIKT